MGNAVRSLYGQCCKPEPGNKNIYYVFVPTPVNSPIYIFRSDLVMFQKTSQVPAGLSNHVESSKKDLASWYSLLLAALRSSKQPPTTAEEAARFIIKNLSNIKKADLNALLAYYGLPMPERKEGKQSEPAPGVKFVPIPERKEGKQSEPAPGVKFELQTLPVVQKAIGDGDTMTVYVSTSIPRESGLVPERVLVAVDKRSKARAVRDYQRADALHDIIIKAGYRMLRIGDNEEILARKYRIQLKGIDAPEVDMPYGEEAKNELARLVGGRTLKVLVYDIDQYDRCVGDVYCNGVFVQELMLKRGMAWHYTAYDQRPDFARWEKEARQHRRGLWAASNPEKPWEWRKRNPRRGE